MIPDDPQKYVFVEDGITLLMPLEDEINARLRHLSEELRAFRRNIDQLRREQPPRGIAGEISRTPPEPPPPPQKPSRRK